MPRPKADRVPQGDPEEVVYFPARAGTLVGLCIKGVGGPTLLEIREDAEGVPIWCAIIDPAAQDR